MTGNDPEKRIHNYLRERRSELVEFTQTLCSFDTQNPPGRNYKPFVDFLADVLKKIGLTVKIIRVPDDVVRQYTAPECWDFPRYNLIAKWDVGSKKTLHFNSHYDVVPVSSDWKRDPFSPFLSRGRLYGRGTSDMKGCIASCVFAVKALRGLGLQPSWNVELSFTCDEEIGGQCGVGHLVKERLIRPNAAVVCEGGADTCIMSGHRGVFWTDVSIQGVSAHGSNPAVGVNAFEKGIALASRFQQLHESHFMRETNHIMDRDSARRPSMTLGGVSGGGTKVNTIPGDFHFTIDRRLIPEENVSELKREYRNLLKTAMNDDSKLKAKLNVLMAFNAAITNTEASICQIAQNAVQNVFNKRGKLRVFGAFTDLHFFVNQAKCPTIGYGVEGDGIHGSNEYLVVQSLIDVSRVYADITLSIK